MNKTKKYSQSCLLLIVAIVLQLLLDAKKAGGSVRRSSSSNGCPKVNAVEGFDIVRFYLLIFLLTSLFTYDMKINIDTG
jgi:hypothetical protein